MTNAAGNCGTVSGMNSPVEISIEEAIRRLPPVGRTTFDRMRDTAAAEMSRVESSQLARLVSGVLAEPMPGEMKKRDDLFALVRLIDIILSDKMLIDRLSERRAAQRQAELATEDNTEIEPV